MRSLILALCLLAPAHAAFAEDCSTAPENAPCTPTPGEETSEAKDKIRGLITAAKDMERNVKALEERYRAVRNNVTIPDEEKFEICRSYREKKRTQDDLYKQAIDETAKLYHVYPDRTDQVTFAPSSDPQLSWMTGLAATWNPQVTDSGSQTKLAVKIWGTDGADHYGGLESMDPKSMNSKKPPRYAVTLADGRALILKGTFDLALDSQNHDLGFLASVLFHETRHFNYLSRECADGPGTCGWASATEDERDAYKEQNRLADVFELKGSDRTGFIKQWKKFNEDAKSGRLESFNPDPEEAARWERYYPNQIDLEAEYSKLKETVDAARREQDRQRQEEAAQRQREEGKRQTMSDYRDAVQNCGMTAMMNPQGLTLGFSLENQADFMFTEPVSLGQAKAAILMAHACATGFTGQRADLCTDGLSPLQSSWNDQNFKHGLELEVDNGQLDGCLRALRAQSNAPGSLADLNLMIGRYRADWRVRAGNRMRETERQYAERQAAKEQEEQDRRERWAERRQRSDRTDSWDLTPAYEALERARRSHF